MITLAILMNIWFIVSVIRIKRKQVGKSFNPYDGTFPEYLGLILGGAVFIITIIVLSIAYLP
jgi:hypothetical protein